MALQIPQFIDLRKAVLPKEFRSHWKWKEYADFIASFVLIITFETNILSLLSGMTWEQCLERCPQGVVPACHNAEDTVTISGPQVRCSLCVFT